MSLDWTIALFVKATLLLLGALVIDTTLRRRWVLSVAALWNAVLLALVALPATTLLTPSLQLPLWEAQPSMREAQLAAGPDKQGSSAGSPILAAKDAPTGADSLAAQRGENTAPSIVADVNLAWNALAWLYALGVAAGFARLAASWRSVEDLRQHGHAVTDRIWLDRVDHWRTYLRLPAGAVRLQHCDSVSVPVALGVRDRVIMIPSSMIKDASAGKIDAILLHELAHLVRADYGWQLLQRVVEAALWWHPLAWIAGRRMAFIRERACDEFVVHATQDAQGYADTLVEIASRMSPVRHLALGLAVVRSSNLGRRLQAMAQSSGNKGCQIPAAARWAFAAGVFLVTAVVASLAVGRVPADETAQKLPPAQAEYEKQVEGDISLEIVGISESPSTPTSWWQPDGSPLAQAPYTKSFDKAIPQADVTFAREFAIRILRPDSATIDIQFNPPSNVIASSFPPAGQPDKKPGVVAATFPIATKKVNVRFKIATGPWNSSFASGAEGSCTVGELRDGKQLAAAFAPTIEKDGALIATVAHNIMDQDVRLIAVGLDDRVHTTGRVQGIGTSPISQINATFANLAIKDVNLLRLQTRPYRWEEIKGVHLWPKAAGQGAK
jgi:beta-lactamase regulating signal transducer with metallopeptidase domain